MVTIKYSQAIIIDKNETKELQVMSIIFNYSRNTIQLYPERKDTSMDTS